MLPTHWHTPSWLAAISAINAFFAFSNWRLATALTLEQLLKTSIGLQIDLVAGMMDCLYAECTPCITDCVLAELEKLGQKYRVALKVAKVCSRT